MKKILATLLCVALLTEVAFGYPPASLPPLLPVLSAQVSPFVRIRGENPQRGRSHVFILEDVHLNSEAQKNLAATLEILAKDNPQLVLGVEGSSGAFDYSPFRKGAASGRKKIAESFVEEGRIGAASLAGLVLSKKLLSRLDIKGVESPDLYSQNVAAYRQAMEIKERVDQELAVEEAAMDQKALSYSPDIQKFYSRKRDYNRGRLSIGDYLDQLSLWISSEQLPFALETFLAAYHLERTLDFPRAESQRNTLLAKLSDVLSPSDQKNILDMTRALGDHRIRPTDFNHLLQSLFAKYKISLSSAPAFQSYLQYVSLVDAVDASVVLTEMAVLERTVEKQMASSPSEKDFLMKTKRLGLKKKLVEFALTPYEWKEYTGSSPIFELSEGEVQKSNLIPFANFYRMADKRNPAMVERFGNSPVSVLLVGGFHTAALTELLRNQGKTVSVLTPRITKIETQSGAEALKYFLREKSSLEKLFAGRKLFLGLPEGIGPVDPQVEAPPLRAGAPRDFFKLLNKETGWSAAFGLTLLLILTIESYFGVSFPLTLSIFLISAVLPTAYFPLDRNKLERMEPEEIPTEETKTGMGASTAVFSRDGQWMATAARVYGHTVGSKNNYVSLVRIFKRTSSGWEAIHKMTHDAEIRKEGLAFSPDGKILAIPEYQFDILLWDVELGKKIKSLHNFNGTVTALAFHPDGHRLVTGSLDNELRLWDIHQPAGKELVFGPPRKVYRESAINSLAFDPSGRFLAAGSEGGYVHLVEVGSKITEMSSHEGSGSNPISAVAISPDGSKIAYASSKEFRGSVAIWDLHPKQKEFPAAKIFGGLHRVTSVAFSPDGKFLVYSDIHRDIYLWDVENHRDITPRQGFRSSEWSSNWSTVSFSRDGRKIIASGQGGIIQEWMLPVLGPIEFPSQGPVVQHSPLLLFAFLSMNSTSSTWATILFAAYFVYSILKIFWKPQEKLPSSPLLSSSMPAVESQGLSDWGALAYEQRAPNRTPSHQLNLIQVKNAAQVSSVLRNARSRSLTVLIGPKHLSPNNPAVLYIDEALYKDRNGDISLPHALQFALTRRASRNNEWVQAFASGRLKMALSIQDENWTVDGDVVLDGKAYGLENTFIQIYIRGILRSLLPDLKTRATLEQFFRSLKQAAVAA